MCNSNFSTALGPECPLTTTPHLLLERIDFTLLQAELRYQAQTQMCNSLHLLEFAWSVQFFSWGRERNAWRRLPVETEIRQEQNAINNSAP